MWVGRSWWVIDVRFLYGLAGLGGWLGSDLYVGWPVLVGDWVQISIWVGRSWWVIRFWSLCGWSGLGGWSGSELYVGWPALVGDQVQISMWVDRLWCMVIMFSCIHHGYIYLCGLAGTNGWLCSAVVTYICVGWPALMGDYVQLWLYISVWVGRQWWVIMFSCGYIYLCGLAGTDGWLCSAVVAYICVGWPALMGDYVQLWLHISVWVGRHWWVIMFSCGYIYLCGLAGTDGWLCSAVCIMVTYICEGWPALMGDYVQLWLYISVWVGRQWWVIMFSCGNIYLCGLAGTDGWLCSAVVTYICVGWPALIGDYVQLWLHIHVSKWDGWHWCVIMFSCMHHGYIYLCGLAGTDGWLCSTVCIMVTYICVGWPALMGDYVQLWLYISVWVGRQWWVILFSCGYIYLCGLAGSDGWLCSAVVTYICVGWPALIGDYVQLWLHIHVSKWDGWQWCVIMFSCMHHGYIYPCGLAGTDGWLCSAVCIMVTYICVGWPALMDDYAQLWLHIYVWVGRHWWVIMFSCGYIYLCGLTGTDGWLCSAVVTYICVGWPALMVDYVQLWLHISVWVGRHGWLCSAVVTYISVGWPALMGDYVQLWLHISVWVGRHWLVIMFSCGYIYLCGLAGTDGWICSAMVTYICVGWPALMGDYVQLWLHIHVSMCVGRLWWVIIFSCIHHGFRSLCGLAGLGGWLGTDLYVGWPALHFPAQIKEVI